MGMAERQYGQSFVVGSAGGTSFSLRALLTPFTRRKMANATMTKLIMVLIKMPQFMVTAPAALAAAGVA